MSSQRSTIIITDKIRDTLRKLSTATIATQLFKRGLRQQFLVGLRPLRAEHSRFVGEAVTMRFIPMREDIDSLDTIEDPANLQWRIIEEIGHNEVIVVDSRSDPSAASSGGILLTRAMKRGAAGFVTDGSLRDAYTSIAALGLPVFMRTASATTRLSRFHVADLQVPIGCAGVAVYPGDVLVADEDGVIVIPRHMAEAVGVDGLAQEELEAYLEARIAAGESLTGVYPPNQQTLDEYEARQDRSVSGQPGHGARRAERVIRAYFAACNAADVDALEACFTDDAVHYFPAGMPDGPWRGARVIAENWARFVRELGSAWTIDRFLSDPTGTQAIIEWTHYKTRLNTILRGDEWYVLDPLSGRIKEIRAYYAAPADQSVAANELVGFDYADRGYHLECPIPRDSASGGRTGS